MRAISLKLYCLKMTEPQASLGRGARPYTRTEVVYHSCVAIAVDGIAVPQIETCSDVHYI